jgi:hypothetical protein
VNARRERRIWVRAIILMLGVTTLGVFVSCDEEHKPLVRTPYPRELVGKPLPVSDEEAKSKNALAKYTVPGKASEVLDWYRQRGFNVGGDSHDAGGYGPYGLSFWLYSDSRADGTNILLVCRWNDF